jgi:hypothetical protein
MRRTKEGNVFAKPRGVPDAAADRPAASDAARITGGGLVQAIVTSLSPFTYYLFLNDREVPQAEVESLSVSVDAGDGSTPGMVRASLSRYVKDVTGGTNQQYTELFPCTLEIVAQGRRICVSCPNAGSLDGLWINLGLRPDGSGAEVQGAKVLRIVLTEGILDAKLTWMDGQTEDLLAPRAT